MVAVRAGAAALLALALGAWTLGPLFVQPAPGARAGAGARAGELGQAGFSIGLADSVEPAAVEGRPLNGLLLGLALGLLVGITGAGFPGAASAEGEAPPADFDIRTAAGSIKDKEKLAYAWAKEKTKAWAQRQFTQPPDAKYKLPTTGAGRYKQFGMDFFSPVGTIPDADDGRYPLKNTLVKAKDDPRAQEAVKRAQGSVLKPSQYGNFYSPRGLYKEGAKDLPTPYSYRPM